VTEHPATNNPQPMQPLGLPGAAVADADVDPREAILEVKNLRTSFPTVGGFVHAVDNVSFNVRKGEALALVGESGCGKSVTAMSIMRLVAPPGRITAGEVRFKGKNLADLSEREMRTVRGNDIAMVFQEPMTSLNPVFKIGAQVAEAVRIHNKVSKKEAWKRAGEMLELVSIPDPIKRLDDYPHQLSGGMRQRVMYTGRVVEESPVRELFAAPAHPYTRGLLKSLPSVSAGDPSAPHRLPTIKGMVPPISNLPRGCKFNPRCPDVMDICLGNEPARMIVSPGHDARCYLHGDEADPERVGK
jgi:oligopeptide/dipeptide ABC transporter ATP-binding protein